MSFTRYIPKAAKQYASTVKPRAIAVARQDQSSRMVVQIPKDEPKRSEKYRRWVASLACAHCQKHGPSQCAHGDASKGTAIKASDETCFPLCAAQPGRMGCHDLFGATGRLGKEIRRLLEADYAAVTRAAAKVMGKYPEGWL